MTESNVSAQTFGNLHEANVARQRDWCPDQLPDLSFRGNELAGETGEVCNVIKKLERERLGWRGSRDTVEHLAEELGDVVICASLIAISAGIDLDAAVEAKFNATSEKVGLPHRLALRTPSDGEVVAWQSRLNGSPWSYDSNGAIDHYRQRCEAVGWEFRPLYARPQGMEVLLSLVHQPNPTDPSRWDIAPGKRREFSAFVATLTPGKE